ncbi:hypothetical protein V2G26_012507 [Clonostachys chloroleuca]
MRWAAAGSSISELVVESKASCSQRQAVEPGLAMMGFTSRMQSQVQDGGRFTAPPPAGARHLQPPPQKRCVQVMVMTGPELSMGGLPVLFMC